MELCLSELKDLSSMAILAKMAQVLSVKAEEMKVNEVEGLQISKDGKRVPVLNPLPNAFIVNIGDILEIVTKELYSTIEYAISEPCRNPKHRYFIHTYNLIT
ncbi:Oxoglutarate/iron-dependent dioxygenase - like 10 [Theobroma cacao]|nr:Oxoglutarate/iron-dependent dioxygenase - like 10 [Theobroma cacao]